MKISKSFLFILYWCIPILLWIAQLIFTANSNTQIRYEELADSVRNVFWMQNHKIYDGVSNGVGWYSTLLIIYNLFGFSLFSAKYVRLVISLISLFCLSKLLFKYLGYNKAFLPLLTIGLSPTILFLNSTQTEYGLDLQVLPIFLLLLSSINFKGKKWLTTLQVMFLWGLLMIGASGYPTFIYYVPIFLILFWRKARKQVHWYLVSLAAFLLPLLAIFIYLEPHSRSLLIYDPTTHGGIFRGAGSIKIDADNFAKNLAGFFTDLFIGGRSYHFELNSGEFSLFFPILPVILVFIISFKRRVDRNMLVLALAVMVMILSSLTLDPSGNPGMRRYTPVLAGFYTLLVISWRLMSVRPAKGYSRKSIVVMFAVGLLLIHHLIVYPVNLIHLKDPSPNQYPLWFKTSDTPDQSLKTLVEKTRQEEFKIVCIENNEPTLCRYAEVYAAVAGSCEWNHLNCQQIQGYDLNKGQFINLSVDLWDKYYFEH